MHIPASRAVAIIAGLLTLLVLGGGTVAVGFHNGWLRTGPGTQSRATTPTSAQPGHSGQDPEAAVTRQTFDEGYRSREHDGNRRERRAGRRESDDD